MITWFLTRGVGAAALVMLTASVALGVADVARWRSRRYPRFVIDDLHRSISMAALALVVVHVLASILDTFAPVRLTDAVVPFAGRYRPIWLGLGALSFDLLLLLVVSSVLRPRIGARAWRTIHWAAWACWPVALVHSFGTGSDVKRGWMLVLGVGCTAVVAMAVVVRALNVHGPQTWRARAFALGGTTAGAIALAAWLPGGPLGEGWALRAGTPPELLRFKSTAFTTPPASAAAPRPAAAAERAFAAEGVGSLRQGVDNNGVTLVDIALRISRPETRLLDIRIAGSATGGGGVQMSRSQVSFGPPTDPARYVGRITALQGTHLVARVAPSHGRPLQISASLTIGPPGGRTHGRVSVGPA